METKFELDLLDTSNEISDHYESEKENDQAKYQELISYADNLGVSREKVDELMSSAEGGNLEMEASDACEAVYESDGSDAFNKCRQDYIKKAKKGKSGFWNNLFTGIKNVADTAQTYVPDQNNDVNQNGGKQVDGQRPSANYPPMPNKEVKILGMKPLVFTLVALTTVIVGGVVIAKVVTSKK